MVKELKSDQDILSSKPLMPKFFLFNSPNQKNNLDLEKNWIQHVAISAFPKFTLPLQENGRKESHESEYAALQKKIRLPKRVKALNGQRHRKLIKNEVRLSADLRRS